MPLTVGDRIAHYDVTALIGEGGMGQVYQATDTKLNRQVALKILPEAFATDPDRAHSWPGDGGNGHRPSPDRTPLGLKAGLITFRQARQYLHYLRTVQPAESSQEAFVRGRWPSR